MFIDLESQEKEILQELAALEKEGEAKEPPELVEETELELVEEKEAAAEELVEAVTDSDEDDDEELAGLGKKEKKGFARMRKALKEEKVRNDSLAQQLQEMRERQAKLEGIQEGSQTKERPVAFVDNEPDKDLDPDEWRDWKIRQQEKQINEIIGTTKKHSEAARIQDDIRGIEILERNYSTKDPEYPEKINFLKRLEAEKLRLIQPGITDAQIEQVILRDKLILSRHLYEQLGRDPAEVFAELAVKQGYVSKKNTAPKKQIDIQALNKNMKKNTSLLGGTSQAPAGDEITPEELLNMSMEKMASLSGDRVNRIINNIQ